MIKKLALTLTCTALLTALSTSAYADSISFTFFATGSGVTAKASGLTTSTGATEVIVSDTNPAFSLVPITGTLTILSTGSSSNFSKANLEGNGIVYAAGPANVIDLSITSPECGMSEVCVSGTENGGTLVDATSPFAIASFGGTFNVTYVDPAILSYYGFVSLNSSGSDQLSIDVTALPGAKLTGKFAGATVTITGVASGIPNGNTPEPGSLVLLGTGLLGFAGMLRQRRKAL